MKAVKFTFCTLTLVLVFISISASAQEKLGKEPLIDKISIGANFGSMLAYADVRQYDFYPIKDERKWGFGAEVNYQISPIVSFQLQGAMGKLAGIKRTFRGGGVANLKFNADIYDWSVNTTVSLNRWWAPNLKINERVNVYAMAGVGLINFRTQMRGLYDDKFIRSFGYSEKGTVKEKMTTELSYPVGLGIKVRAAKKIDVILESQLRNVYSDKLDAYVRTVGYRDKYLYTFVGVSYRFGKQENHMEWMNPKDVDDGGNKLALDEANKKIDELSKKLAELENKSKDAGQTGPNDPRFAELDQKIEDLAKKVADIENKTPVTVTNPDGGQQPMDLAQLNDLNQKILDLDNKNKDLNNRIINMQSNTNVTYTGSAPILVAVFFEVNKSNIDKVNEERVAAAAKYLLSNPSAKIELVGHADKTGGQKYNELLSERRAKAVQKALVNDFGIDASRLSISYKGYTEPLSKNNYDVNRRVDFILK